MYLPISMILLSAACIAGLVVLALFLLNRFRRVESLVRYYPDPLITLDGDLKLIACNQAFADLLGYGSIRECVAFFDEYPHFTRDDYQLVKETVGQLGTAPLRLEKAFTLTQRMGGKVEREIEVIRKESSTRTDLRFLPLQSNPGPDDLWLHLISLFEIPVILQDKQGRLVAMNTPAKCTITHRIGDQYSINPSENKKWIQIPLKGNANHRLSFMPGPPQNIATQASIDPEALVIHETNAPETGVAESGKIAAPFEAVEEVAGTWSINLESGKLEQSLELIKLLGYDKIERDMDAAFLWNCIANADKPRIVETFEDYEAGRTSEFRATFRIADVEGAEHYIEIRGNVTERDARGQLVKLVGTHRLLTPPRNSTVQDENTDDYRATGGDGQPNAQANMSPRLVQHELANHLGVVTGYADLLLADPTLSDETRSFVEAIATAGNEAQDSIREQNKTESRKVPAHDVPAEGEDWTTQFNEGLDRLTQILTMYFDAEATREGTTEVRDYTVEADPDYCGVCGDQIELGSHAREVFDSRVRIDHQSLPYVTNPAFYGVSNSNSHNLAELARILHQQNGHMSLSADARGVSVTIYTLPKSVTVKTSLEMGDFGHSLTHRPDSHRQRNGKPRILVVDDEELVSSYFAIVLGRAGYEVTTLNKPQLALRFLNRDHQPCDLLITDQNMPGMTGEELCESVRLKRPELPIILCTGYNSLQRKPIQSDLLSQPGVVSVLKKPLDAQELLEVVQRLIVLAPNNS